MKKIISFIVIICFSAALFGCNNRSLNYIIENEPNISGIIMEVNENSVLIKNDTGEYTVSLNVENKDSVTHFNIHDEVVVYYDGKIAESYPMQINTVYAITLKEPAQRSENAVS